MSKPRFIDANKISLSSQCCFDDNGEIMVSLRDVQKAIAQTPTAVVTCEECKNYNPVLPTCGNCHYTTTIIHPTDFCSRGERKDGKA